MKIALAAVAGLLLAGVSWSPPAQAQGIPQGSYLKSCTDARVQGDTLTARCRRADGREEHSSLAGVNRCTGDIGNNNGSLQCNSRGGPAPAAQGERRGGEPGVGSGGDRCGGLHREAEELRVRLDREFNPLERARTEGRLREVREQEARCR